MRSPEIKAKLFGGFALETRGGGSLRFVSRKARELLAYLLLHRGRVHFREALASVLWGEEEATQPRKCLRQALWQLQSGLRATGRPASHLIRQTSDSLELGPDLATWVDATVLEEAFKSLRGKESLYHGDARRIGEAVRLYQGDLLDGYSATWCVAERDRFREMHLALLDKMIAHSEAVGAIDAGIEYGAVSLRCDRARERTHRALMRLYFRSGDRTAAIRQFERCCGSLLEELDVEPEPATLDLYLAIRAGRLRLAPTFPKNRRS